MQKSRQTEPAPFTSPCCCCRARPHERIPDRDLQGYLCAECDRLAQIAVKALKGAGIEGVCPSPNN